MDVLAMKVFVSALGQSLEHLCTDIPTPLCKQSVHTFPPH